MAIPTTRREFGLYCKRKLGHPVLEINISDEQLDDRIDEALLYYQQYHYNGTERQYYKYQIQAADITNKYITLPDNVIGAVRIFELNGTSGTGTAGLFSGVYQLTVNEILATNGFDLVPYYMTMQNIALIQELLIGQKPIRYNEISKKLYIDMSWDVVTAGNWLIVECFNVLDPADFPRIFQEEWLQNYACALIKQQWGSNLTKFSGMIMPGGVQFNGEKIYNDATAEIAQLKEFLINNLSMPCTDFIG